MTASIEFDQWTAVSLDTKFIIAMTSSCVDAVFAASKVSCGCARFRFSQWRQAVVLGQKFEALLPYLTRTVPNSRDDINNSSSNPSRCQHLGCQAPLTCLRQATRLALHVGRAADAAVPRPAGVCDAAAEGTPPFICANR